MENQEQDINDLIDNNPADFEFDFSKYFQKGFEICNQYLVGFVGFFLLYFLITSFVGALPIIGGWVNELFISPVILVGLHFVARNISRGETHHFDQFWGGLQHFQQLVTLTIIQSVFYMICISPILLSADFSLIMEWFTEWQQYPLEVSTFPGFQFWYFILVLPIIYFSITWMYAPLLVIFYKMPAWEAMEASRKIISKKWLLFAVFSLLVGLVSVSGVLLLGIGILYTMPAGLCVFYASFEDILDFYVKEDGEDDLLKHLIDEAF